MKTYKFSQEQLEIIKESCYLGLEDYDSKFINEGENILIEVSLKKVCYLITTKQTKDLGSFLSNWYNKNELFFNSLQNKMFEASYNCEQLEEFNDYISKLNTILDLLKIFNKSKYEDFFKGVDKTEYKKNLKKCLKKECF